ncbi:MAG: alpha/beta fold hydrolase [Thermoleophilia bacterium]|nr:alpha/beta fold hydrolase [Thermoleophilia bacterium]
MATTFASSADGTRVAYDVTGRGPALVLLHGMGKTRRDWRKAGYVDRLKDEYTVIAIDMRGTGDSDMLTEVSDYASDKVCADVTAVADACGVGRFGVWGYSFGGTVGKQLAASTDRVVALAVVGIPLWGPAVDEVFDRFITDFLAKWQPVADAAKAGSAAGQTKTSAVKGRMAVWVACLQAMRGWPATEAVDLRCPGLLVCGTKSHTRAADWAQANKETLEVAGARVEVVEGLNHQQEFSDVDRVFPVVREFLERPDVEGG